MIPSSSPSVKIQIMSRKVCWRCKGKTILGDLNKLFFQVNFPAKNLNFHFKVKAMGLNPGFMNIHILLLKMQSFYNISDSNLSWDHWLTRSVRQSGNLNNNCKLSHSFFIIIHSSVLNIFHFFHNKKILDFSCILYTSLIIFLFSFSYVENRGWAKKVHWLFKSGGNILDLSALKP